MIQILKKISSTYWSIIILIITGIALRLYLTTILPLTNDEGSYFYDSYLIQQGFIPYKDFLTKSPPHIYLITLFTSFLGNTLAAGRMILIPLFVANSLLIYQISKSFFSRNAALVSLAVFALYPEIAALNTYSQVQNTQMFFSLLFVWTLVSGVFSYPKMIGLAVVFTLGYITRQTSVIYLGLFAFYAFYLFVKEKTQRTEILKHVFLFGFLLFVINILIVIGMNAAIGIHKTLDFYGLEMLSQTTQNIPEGNVIASKINNIGVNGQILYGLISQWGLIFYSLLLFIALGIVVAKEVSLVLLSFVFGYAFFNSVKHTLYFYLSDRFLLTNSVEVFSLYLFILFLFIQLLKMQTKNIVKVWEKLFIFLWFLFLFTIYAMWIKFRAPYIVEFFPVFVLCVGFVFYFVEQYKMRFVQTIFLFALLFIFTFSQLRIFSHYYTGTYKPQVVSNIATIIRTHSTPQDEVLTASLIFPFIAERKIPFNVAHPYWYGYKGFNPTLLQSYMPPMSQYEEYILNNPPKLIIYDKTTKETFFIPSPRLTRFLKTRYKLIYSEKNSTQNVPEVYEYQGS